MNRLVLVSALVLPMAAQAQEVDVARAIALMKHDENVARATAQCEPGSVLVGGGFELYGLEVRVRKSRPALFGYDNLNGWYVEIYRDSLPSGGYQLDPVSKAVGEVYALCMGVSFPPSSDASQPQTPPPAAPSDVAELKTPPAMTPADLAALRTALPAHRVSAGTSRNLEERMAARSWMIESSGIMGMAIASPCPPRPECSPSDDVLVMWYDDGTLSQTPFRSEDGGSLDPIGERQRSPYRLPPGQRPSDIVGIGISGGESVFAWYRDGTRSTGSIRDLGSGTAGERYTLPPGKSPADIVGLAKAPSNGWAYAWYADGTVSAGTDEDLDAHRAPYAYTLPPDVGAADVLDIAIGNGDWVFAWYR